MRCGCLFSSKALIYGCTLHVSLFPNQLSYTVVPHYALVIAEASWGQTAWESRQYVMEFTCLSYSETLLNTAHWQRRNPSKARTSSWAHWNRRLASLGCWRWWPHNVKMLETWWLDAVADDLVWCDLLPLTTLASSLEEMGQRSYFW